MASSGGTVLLCLWVVFCCSNSVFLCSLSLFLSLSSLNALSLPTPFLLSSLSSCYVSGPLPLLLSSPFLLFPPSPFVGLFSLHQVSKWLYWWSLSNLRYGQFLQYVHFFFLSVCLCLTVCSGAACWWWDDCMLSVCLSVCLSTPYCVSILCFVGLAHQFHGNRSSQMKNEAKGKGLLFISEAKCVEIDDQTVAQ